MTDLIFLDTETTGLEYGNHEIWEIAWAVNDGPIEQRILVHSLKSADPKALDLNGYLVRYPEGARSKGPMTDLEVRNVLAGNHIVCANPTFDRIFMFLRWAHEPYHYRSVDVESMALVVFGWDRPRGLKDVSAELRTRGFDIPDPDHTAAKDVEVLRACFNALRVEVDKYKIY
jgi:DNA polymerase III alpha subunit (gram-positive type)